MCSSAARSPTSEDDDDYSDYTMIKLIAMLAMIAMIAMSALITMMTILIFPCAAARSLTNANSVLSGSRRWEKIRLCPHLHHPIFILNMMIMIIIRMIIMV